METPSGGNETRERGTDKPAGGTEKPAGDAEKPAVRTETPTDRVETSPGAGQNSMDKHITLLGALFIAFHIIGLLFGFGLMAMLSAVGVITGDPAISTVFTSIGLGFGGFLVVLSIPGIVAGVWLLMRRPWARILALIVGAFNLVNVPFGTALGIYSFWVLLHDETERIFAVGRAESG